jgi:hypothetical protein
MTRRKRSTRSKRSKQSTRSKKSTRGGVRAKSERPSFHQTRKKHQKHKLKYAHMGVFHKMTPRTTHRFASGRDVRKFLKNRYKHEKYLDAREAAARSVANASRKREKIANSVSSGPMAGVTMSEE